MLKYQKYSLLLFGLLLMACSGKRNSGESFKTLSHARNVKVLTVSNTKFILPDTASKYQVVTFAANFNKWSILNSPWEKSQLDFPEVEYIFYYSGEDTTGLKEWMVQTEFAYPIFHDYNGEFKEKNIVDRGLTSISFLVKNGRQVGLGHAANPTYKEKLERAFYSE